MTANIEYPRGIDFDPFAEPEDEPLCFKDVLDLPGADEKPQVYAMIGSPKVGKTHMLKSMMHIFESRKQFSWGITFGEPDQYTWMPTRSVRIYDDEYFKNYITNLRQKQFEGVKIPPNYVVFDDFFGHFTAWQNKFMSIHRQTNTTVFILCQLLTARGAVSTTMRANTSYAMMWPTASQNVNIHVVKDLYEHFGGELSYEKFEQALRACHKKQYSCLVYKNSPEIEQFCTIVAPTFPEGFQLKF